MTSSHPRLERDGDLAYFTASDGARWRVYDVGFGPPHAAPGKIRTYGLEDARGNYRYFINAERVRRAYQFQRGETHALTATDLDRQLLAAGYVGTQSAEVPRHPTR